jgi:hypothetical protein
MGGGLPGVQPDFRLAESDRGPAPRTGRLPLEFTLRGLNEFGVRAQIALLFRHHLHGSRERGRGPEVGTTRRRWRGSLERGTAGRRNLLHGGKGNAGE